MNESTQKALLSLLSVIVGWFLAQGTTLISTWWKTRRLKKALLTELDDVAHRLAMVERFYGRKLQIYALDGVEVDATVKLTNPIYSKYYPEICFKLNRAQRSSYELIHGYVEIINSGLDRIAELSLSIAKEKKELNEQRFEEYGDAVKAQFHNVQILFWHLEFHHKHKRNPEIGGLESQSYRDLLKTMDESDKKIEDIIEQAKGLNREDFLKAYPDAIAKSE